MDGCKLDEAMRPAVLLPKKWAAAAAAAWLRGRRHLPSLPAAASRRARKLARMPAGQTCACLGWHV